MNTPLPLNTGSSIPALGFGTWQSPPGEVKKAVYYAIKSGYRHIDCAYCYQNEDEVGEAITQATNEGIVTRQDLFITSKLWCTFHQRVEQNLDMTLKSLGTEYVDLYLMHWPCPQNENGSDPLFPKHPDGSRDLDPNWTYIQTWQSMEKLSTTGKVRAIGVANHSVQYLEELLKSAKIIPAVNQIENHPRLPQDEILDFCKQKKIHVTAYSPLGSTGSPLFKDKIVQKIAKKHNVGHGTVLLSWHSEFCRD
jgi:glycerol 2-dehydrogenase (NADP+)